MGARRLLVAVLVAAIALVLNATLRYARVDVDEEEVVVRLGPLGEARIPRRSVAMVRRIPWRWYHGYGIRFYGPQAVGFVGRPGDIVEFVLSEPVTVRAVIPVTVSRLAVSVEDPDGLIERFAQGKEEQAAE